MKPDYLKQLESTDKEFSDFFHDFAYHEVINEKLVKIDDKSRYLGIVPILLGSQSLELYKAILPDVLQVLTPDEVKEIVYQAVAYLGIGRVYPFLIATNTVFEELGVQVESKTHSTTNRDNRFEKGLNKQIELFGPQMKDAVNNAPQETKHIRVWLADNCFGDYYTRDVFSNAERELITFGYLAGQGTEPQLKAHIGANAKNGNSKEFLIAVASQAMPYIGYPRTLNTLRCIEEVLGEE